MTAPLPAAEPTLFETAIVEVYRREQSERRTAEELGCSRRRVRAVLASLGRPEPIRGGGAGPRSGQEQAQEQPGVSTDYRRDSAIVESRGRIRKLDELLAAAAVDLDTWEVERYVVNPWEMGRKDRRVELDYVDGKATGSIDDTGGVAVETLWQVKAWLRRRVDHLAAQRLKAEVLAAIAAHAPAYPPLERSPPAGDQVLLEVSACDLHLGKLAWDDETGGGHYDTAIASSALLTAVDELLARSGGFAVARILYVVGNDLLHTDGPGNMTTEGTPQDVDTRHARLFRLGWQLQVAAIDRLRLRAPVDVLVVPGNHDRDASFKLGEVLAAWYRACPDVAIDNAPSLRKYYRWGRVLLGLTHGSEEAERDLPLIMAQERAAEWAATTHREWHLGHFHKRREARYVAGDTLGGVCIRVLPSLSATDAWHARRGYVAPQRAAEAYLWGETAGYVGHLSANLSTPEGAW